MAKSIEELRAKLQAQLLRIEDATFLEALQLLLTQHLEAVSVAKKEFPSFKPSVPDADSEELQQRVADDLKDGEIESWLKDVE